MAQEPFKLKPLKLKQFITKQYGPNIAEKLQNLIDFNGPVDFHNFCYQIELVLKDRNLLLQAAYDSFDLNNDNKISELDLFKFVA